MSHLFDSKLQKQFLEALECLQRNDRAQIKLLDNQVGRDCSIAEIMQQMALRTQLDDRVGRIVKVIKVVPSYEISAHAATQERIFDIHGGGQQAQSQWDDADGTIREFLASYTPQRDGDPKILVELRQELQEKLLDRPLTPSSIEIWLNIILVEDVLVTLRRGADESRQWVSENISALASEFQRFIVIVLFPLTEFLANLSITLETFKLVHPNKEKINESVMLALVTLKKCAEGVPIKDIEDNIIDPEDYSDRIFDKLQHLLYQN